MAVVGYFSKLKWHLGLVFGAHFHRNVPYLMIIYGQSFNVKPFFLSKISDNVLLSSYLDN